MKKILIIGVDGFTGGHLWEYLKKNEKQEIIGTHCKPLDGFKRKLLKGCSILKCNVNSYPEMKNVLAKTIPVEIYFLSSLVTVARSFETAVDIYETNILGLAKFFEACQCLCPKARVLVTGSAEEYGKVKKEVLPIKESCQLCAVSPYGLSKILQEEVARYYFRNHGLDVRMTRTFHFAGIRQPPTFVVSDFASQIASIEAGLREPVISVGNLNAKRDFTDIRDVVRAYYLIMKKAQAGETFNVCSGRSVVIQSVLDELLSQSTVKITVKKDLKKLRKADVPDFRGDNTKLIQEIGWRPEIHLKQTFTDVLNWWRECFSKDSFPRKSNEK